MKREFRTEVYLLTGSELRVVRCEGGEEQSRVDEVEYTPIHSPRGGSAMGGVHFFVPTVARPDSISPLTVASRPPSPPTAGVRSFSPPTRPPLMTVAEVQRPVGGEVFIFEGNRNKPAASARQATSFNRSLFGRHSDRALRRMLPRNPDGAGDRLC